MAPIIKVGKDTEELSDLLAEQVVAALTKGDNQKVVIGLSGGSLPKFFVQACQGDRLKDSDWSKVVFIFCDERLVPFENPDSTFKLYDDALVGKVGSISKANFIVIDPGLTAAEAAKDYAKKLEGLGTNVFDLLLLGMGPDGHTCSLFPNHPLLDEKSLVVAPITDSPKPPPERVTLTYPVLNKAKKCVFVCTGEGKKDVVRDILEGGVDYPAGRVRPDQHGGELVWILDQPAASQLSTK